MLPKFGFTLETADIVQGLKQDGDTVRAGDPICEVTTDKVNMEVEAPESGTFINPLYPAGATVPVTEIIAYLLRPGEERPADFHTNPHPPAPSPLHREGEKTGGAVPASQPTTASSVAATPLAQRVADAANLDLTQVKGSGPNNRITRRDVESALAQPAGKVRATPAARHIAEQQHVDLHTVPGSGPRGRIQAADVQAATQNLTPQPPLRIQRGGDNITGEFIPSDAPRFVKMEGMRKTIATRLQKSFQTAPHIFFDAQIETTAIDALRQKLKARNEKLSVTTIVVKACASVLMRHPYLNATLDGEDIALWPTANIGVAVALEGGLIVPVVQHAERQSMRDIQTAVDDLATRARANTLKVNDMVDGTFTVSNLGMFGVDRFTAIINPPQVAILAVGRSFRQFVPDADDQPGLRSFMTVTLSADHRVVDGAQAANFIQDLRTVLEEPGLLAW
ncbi:MAG: dihydrolipoamide acetyltransferase family protein [Anaerolineae bacterium]